MRYMMTYDLMETARNTNQWLGATARTMASYPIFSLVPNPAFSWMAAWGEVTERTFERMIVKPDWAIRTFTCEDGKDHLVEITTVLDLAETYVDLNRSADKHDSALAGLTQINMFFENSTRTQASFEIAGKRLGADVMNMNMQA